MILKPLKMTRAPPYFESEPESSPTGPCAVSGDKLAGAGLGGVPLDGSVTGASPESPNSMECSPKPREWRNSLGRGTHRRRNRHRGRNWRRPICRRARSWRETDVAGGLAGDLAGESDGDFAGGETDGDFDGGVDTGGETVGVDVGGETVGADVGGEVVGDLEVGVGAVAGEMAGEVAGEVDGEGDFVGTGFGEGAGAGALSACTTPECETHKTNI
ncbi:hypothetical protein SLA2020_352220 [Shorea laevis]